MNSFLVTMSLICAILAMFNMQSKWHDPILRNEPLCLRWIDRFAMLGYTISLLWLTGYAFEHELASINPITTLIVSLVLMSMVRSIVLLARGRLKSASLHPWSIRDAIKH